MNDRDAFFTQTIVGAPFTAFLGRRQAAGSAGMSIGLGSGTERLGDEWRDWMTLGRDADLSGRPRRRPGRLTRWMERHALVLAMVGAGSFGLGLAMIGLSRWH